MAQRAVELCQEGERYLTQKLGIPAENVFWQSLQINHNYAPALIGMGRAKAEQGDFANALMYLNRVIVLDPLNAPVHYNLSIVYQRQGREAEARAEMTKLREADSIGKQ
jgi:Flp pilus assembly protein TadD